MNRAGWPALRKTWRQLVGQQGRRPAGRARFVLPRREGERFFFCFFFFLFSLRVVRRARRSPAGPRRRGRRAGVQPHRRSKFFAEGAASEEGPRRFRQRHRRWRSEGSGPAINWLAPALPARVAAELRPPGARSWRRRSGKGTRKHGIGDAIPASCSKACLADLRAALDCGLGGAARTKPSQRRQGRAGAQQKPPRRMRGPNPRAGGRVPNHVPTRSFRPGEAEKTAFAVALELHCSNGRRVNQFAGQGKGRIGPPRGGDSLPRRFLSRNGVNAPPHFPSTTQREEGSLLCNAG